MWEVFVIRSWKLFYELASTYWELWGISRVNEETSDTGYLQAYSDVANLKQTYDFTYNYSQGNGKAEFYENNLGTVNFAVFGNQLAFDGETFTRQD